MTELLPCPFCGHEPHLSHVEDADCPGDPYADDWKVECWHCAATPTGDRVDRARAIREWNNRPQEESLLLSLDMACDQIELIVDGHIQADDPRSKQIAEKLRSVGSVSEPGEKPNE